MDISEWQKRLEKTFIGPNNIVGERVMQVIDGETAYKETVVNKYIGHRFLSDSFFDFYMETLGLATDWVQKNGYPKNAGNYSMLFFRHVATFRNLRAAENVSVLGYPLDGLSLLRNVKDQAIFLGAIANGFTTLYALWGYSKKEDMKKTRPEDIKSGIPIMQIEQFAELRKKAKKEEDRIFDIMLRKKSGLYGDHIKELSQWEDLFNIEIHGSRFTYAFEMVNWFMGVKSPSLVPQFEEPQIAMYMNRVNEIEWLILRTLPFMQLDSFAFGKEWAKKWKILDESFYIIFERLWSQNKNSIALAIIELAENKFRFSPELLYFEK